MLKVGDEVKYVKGGKIDWEESNWCDKEGLELGEIYTVSKLTFDYNGEFTAIRVKEGNKDFNLHPDHFEKVKDHFVVGDLVEFVHNTPVAWETKDKTDWREDDGLMVGNNYTVSFVDVTDISVSPSNYKYSHHKDHFRLHVHVCKYEGCNNEFLNSKGYCGKHYDKENNNS